MLVRSFALALLFWWIHWNSAMAQTPSLEAINLDSVILSATRLPQRIVENERSSLLLQKDMQATLSRTLGELLVFQTGLSLNGAWQTPGSLQGISQRGLGGNHVSILRDGIPILDTSTPDRSLDLSELSLLAVRRLEIVRGPQTNATIPGAAAGSISLFSPVPHPGEQSLQMVSTVGSFGKGNYTRDHSLQIGLAEGKFFFQAGMYTQDTRGFNATLDTSQAGPRFADPDDDFHKTDLTLSVGYQTKRHFSRLRVWSVDQVAEIDDGPFRDDDNHVSRFSRRLYDMAHHLRIGKDQELILRQAYSELSRSITDDSSRALGGPSDRTYLSTRNTGQYQFHEISWNFNPSGWKLAAGFQFLQERMNGRSRYQDDNWGYAFESSLDTVKPRSNLASLFLLQALEGKSLHPSLAALNLSAGIRYGMHSTFQPAFTFEFRPTYLLAKGIRAYASFSTAYNPPSLYQMYANEITGAEFTLGNAALQAERIFQHEAGILYQGKSLQGRIGYFANRMRHPIQYVNLWTQDIPVSQLGFADYRGSTYLNISSQHSQGLEWEIDFQPFEELRLRCNGNLLQSRIRFSEEGSDISQTKGYQVQSYLYGEFLGTGAQRAYRIRRPDQVHFSAHWGLRPNVWIQTNLSWTGPREDGIYDLTLGPFGALNGVPLPAFTLLHLTFGWQAMPGLLLSARVENLLQEKPLELWGYATRPRTFLFQASWDIQLKSGKPVFPAS